jgi:hypothetical protein
MVSAKREREKIQSSQISVEMTLSRRVCHNISNSENGTSNRVTYRNIFMIKVWST